MYYDPPRNPLPAHGQLVRSPYGTPDCPLTPRRGPFKSRVPGMLAMVLVPPLAIGAVAVAGEHLTAPDPQITLRSGLGFAGELALVPYDRTGSGGLVDSLANDAFQVRIAAVDLATGDLRWDVQLADEPGWGAAVVAAGETYAYLATDDGLTVLGLDDGAVAAEPGSVPGLEGAQAASGAAYGFDPALGAVVALDVDGGLHTIALDALEAAPADADTAAAWSGRLTAEGGVPDIGGLTTTRALLADGESTVSVTPTAEGALGATLAVEGPDGGRRALGTRVFYEAAIVLDQTAPASTTLEIDVDDLIAEFAEDPAGAAADLWTGLGDTAAGAASGHVLVEHRPEPNGDAYALHVVSLENGRVTASFDTAAHLGRAATSPGGRTVVITAPPDDPRHSDLVVVAPDGSIDRVEFGETDLLGEPVLE
ncbi:hypothetical protein LO763_19050 [Glycomyces sp. A-F 0318]|uniref:PA2928 family protein n=1 Tax=Glycomyces amatae TaxID=2881355 RepID=UPI001E5EDC8E|nr:PA2928 family protein [Glycomyces amatae]MCD0445709.1 hypothetical protein [Glycomyces amatae]